MPQNFILELVNGMLVRAHLLEEYMFSKRKKAKECDLSY
ncbi:uncharacterized protein CHAB577_0896 [Chlamydia abortus]|nr:uncharacterized protein CHAB577_0896 [Chlamydia abortus]